MRMIHKNIWRKIILDGGNTSEKALKQEPDWYAKEYQEDGSEREMKTIKQGLRDMEDRQKLLKNKE